MSPKTYIKRKTFFFYLVIVFLFALSANFPAQTKAVGVLESRSEVLPIAAGKEGLAQLMMSVKKGYKLAKRPGPKIEMTPVPGFEIVSVAPFTERTPSDDPEYFGRLNPIAIRIAASKATKPGNYLFEGKVTYFFCSQREMYCSRSIEPLRIPVEVLH